MVLKCSAGSALKVPNSDGKDVRSLSGNELPTGHAWLGAGTGKGFKVIVTLVQCINSGIDNDAASTMTHAAICTCGFRTRKTVRASHTALPSTKERSAASARTISIISSLPSFFRSLGLGLRNLVGQHAKLPL